MQLGSNYLGNGRCLFNVWAPNVRSISLHLTGPVEKIYEMASDGNGYYFVELEGIIPNVTQYFYRINDGVDRPDPATHYQPGGVHGPSEVIDHSEFSWTDLEWKNISIEKIIIYELHVGTFTHDGTFLSIIPQLDYLNELGVNAIELLPCAQFSGKRNWGYDGVCPYAVHNTYGTPNDFKTLINACHQKGIAVIMDIVYNHLGPEGNYLPEFGPYFNPIYKSPWGYALNFDSEYSDEVRRYFIENALYWQHNYHIDGMRQDAAHMVFDMGVRHIWQDIITLTKRESEASGRSFYMFAETSRNDIKFINTVDQGGLGFDGLWLDDFHHALHTLFVHEKGGYYSDFGSINDLAKAFQKGFVISGQYSNYRKKKMGSDSSHIKGDKFIVFSQNHDQVGNRAGSTRLSTLVSFDELKLISATYLLSPYIPMIFMGEEYAETAPFYFFTDHQDTALQEAVKKGRMEEYAGQGLASEMADPGLESTFLASKININLHTGGQQQILFRWYQSLLNLRKYHPVLLDLSKESLKVKIIRENMMYWERSAKGQTLSCFLNFSREWQEIDLDEDNELRKITDSADRIWMGDNKIAPNEILGAYKLHLGPFQFVLYEKINKQQM